MRLTLLGRLGVALALILPGIALTTKSAIAQPAERAALPGPLFPAPRHSSDEIVTGVPLESFQQQAQERSALVGCTSGQIVQQTALTNAYTITTAGGGAGQSFMAPCDGFLTSIAFGQNVGGTPSNAGLVTAVNYYVIAGEGLAGTILDSNGRSFTNGAAGTGTTLFTLTMYRPVPVTQGAVYTLFVEYSSGGSLRPTFSTANPYPSGQLYNGGTAVPASDLTFVLNFAPATAATTPVVFNGPGYRLLSAPLTRTTVKDVAALNLVQGIAGDGSTVDAPDDYPRQYPSAAPNLYTTYNGNGTYTKPTATFDFLTSGRGFFWQWYDRVQPGLPSTTIAGGGTSFSRELTDYRLSLTGVAPTASVVTSLALTADGYYMLGNPFALPLAVTGLTLTAGTGTLVTSVQAWDPSTSTYKILFASNPNTSTTDYIAVWDGVFAQVTGGTTAPTFTYAIASTSGTATAPFYGRSAETATPYVQLRLDGTTASGAPVADAAAYVRFLPESVTGQDADDAGKLTPPPGIAYALISPVAEHDGAPVRLAVDALPSDLTEAATVPVAFTANEAGSFTLTWTGASDLPDDWSATLRDTRTGDVTDLRTAESYPFTSEATDWEDRFELHVAPNRTTAGEAGAPAEFALAAPTPNPTATSTAVTFDIPSASDVDVAVYDLLGRRVATLAQGQAAAGRHTVRLDAGALAPGVYVVRMSAGTFSAIRRVTVVR